MNGFKSSEQCSFLLFTLMASQTISSSTSTTQAFVTAHSQAGREILLTQFRKFRISRRSSHSMPKRANKSAENIEVITLSSSDSEDEDDASSDVTLVTGEVEECTSSGSQTASVKSNNSDSSGKEDVLFLESSESDDEEYMFDSWQAPLILLVDDKENPPVNSKVKRRMLCHRCPTEKLGTFTNEEKFRIHIQRHLYGDVFQCTTCQRPFSKISYCISHEIRVHGAQINYNVKDKVISYAKKYVEERDAKRAQRAAARACTSTNPNSDDETDDETDDEDPKFYNNHIVTSTALYPYRGPPVKHLVEAYEIHMNHFSHRNKHFNQIAEAALEVHQENVGKKYVTYKLRQCPFSKKKKSSAVGKGEKPSKRNRRKKTTFKFNAVATKRPSPVDAQEQTQQQPCSNPKKSKSNLDLSSCSEEEDGSNDEDADYQPRRKLRSNLKLK